MTNQSLARRWETWAPELRSVLRIAAAFVFIQYGTMKLLAFPGPLLPSGGTVPLTSLAGVAGVIEIVGGALLLLGLFTRPIAFLASGEMAVAYFHSHAPRGVLTPILTHGDPAVLFCFVWLYLSAAGAGPWSLDALLRRRPT